MHHFYAPNENADSGVIAITGPDAGHIRRVLRMSIGDLIRVSDGRDRDCLCRITGIGRDRVTAEVLSAEAEDTELPVRIHLFQGLPKGDKMTFILQKAVELGAASLEPVAMKRCAVVLDEQKKTARREKWQRQAESAAKQCGRRLVMDVGPVLSFREALDRAESCSRILVPYEEAENMKKTREILSSLKAGEDVAVFIGPEGGFDGEEIEALKAAGAQVLTLGRRILRTETAGMALLAMCVLTLEP